MSVFGKILIAFNFILAIVVLLVAGMDYGKRQSWRYAALKHEALIVGLPVDENEENEKEPGSPIAKDFKPGVLKDLFANVSTSSPAGLAAGPVGTVVEELKRVKVAVTRGLTSNANAQVLLVPQARTLEEREKLIKMVNGDDANFTACNT